MADMKDTNRQLAAMEKRLAEINKELEKMHKNPKPNDWDFISKQASLNLEASRLKSDITNAKMNKGSFSNLDNMNKDLVVNTSKPKVNRSVSNKVLKEDTKLTDGLKDRLENILNTVEDAEHLVSQYADAVRSGKIEGANNRSANKMIQDVYAAKTQSFDGVVKANKYLNSDKESENRPAAIKSALDYSDKGVKYLEDNINKMRKALNDNNVIFTENTKYSTVDESKLVDLVNKTVNFRISTRNVMADKYKNYNEWESIRDVYTLPEKRVVAPKVKTETQGMEVLQGMFVKDDKPVEVPVEPKVNEEKLKNILINAEISGRRSYEYKPDKYRQGITDLSTGGDRARELNQQGTEVFKQLNKVQGRSDLPGYEQMMGHIKELETSFNGLHGKAYYDEAEQVLNGAKRIQGAINAIGVSFNDFNGIIKAFKLSDIKDTFDVNAIFEQEMKMLEATDEDLKRLYKSRKSSGYKTDNSIIDNKLAEKREREARINSYLTDSKYVSLHPYML